MENNMVSPAFLMCVILFVVGLILLIMCGCRDEKKLFRPMTRPKGRHPHLSPPFGMRAAAHHPTRNGRPIGGHRMTGPICFVTGMSRSTCACADCQNQGNGR